MHNSVETAAHDWLPDILQQQETQNTVKYDNDHQ